MDEQDLIAAVRYVDMNSVATGLCKSPWGWRFSSARAHLDGQDDTLVRVRPMLERVDDRRGCLAGEMGGEDAELMYGD